MQYCNVCKVNIAGAQKNCPLCGGELEGTFDKNSALFPNIPPPKYSTSFLIRLITFIAIAAMAISAAVNMLATPEVWWSLIVIAAVGTAWLTVIVAIYKRRNILKTVAWQMFLISGAAVLWDVAIGWKGWSLDFVLPGCCAVAMISMFVLAIIFKIPPREYIFYIILDSVYGIVPIIFVLTGILNMVLPSILCILLSVLCIAAILLFQWRNIKEVSERKFHL